MQCSWRSMSSLALNIISKNVINAVMLNVGVWNVLLIVQVAKALPKYSVILLIWCQNFKKWKFHYAGYTLLGGLLYIPVIIQLHKISTIIALCGFYIIELVIKLKDCGNGIRLILVSKKVYFKFLLVVPYSISSIFGRTLVVTTVSVCCMYTCINELVLLIIIP